MLSILYILSDLKNARIVRGFLYLDTVMRTQSSLDIQNDTGLTPTIIGVTLPRAGDTDKII